VRLGWVGFGGARDISLLNARRLDVSCAQRHSGSEMGV